MLGKGRAALWTFVFCNHQMNSRRIHGTGMWISMEYHQPQTPRLSCAEPFSLEKVQTEEFELQRRSAESCTWPWGRSWAGFLQEFLHPPGQEGLHWAPCPAPGGTVTLGQGKEQPLGAPTEREMLDSCRKRARGVPCGILQALHSPSPGSAAWSAHLGLSSTPSPSACSWNNLKPRKNPQNPKTPTLPVLTPELCSCSRDLALKNPKSNVPHGCPEEMQIPEQL